MGDQAVSMETSDLAPSKPNKLFLKLNLPKSLKRCGQHICPVCSKGFTSGKALGGHIRIHMKGRHRKISKLQPRNLHRFKSMKRISKNVVLPKSSDHGAVDQGVGVNCVICDKKFRSEKSLYGHMRKHPERSWRGMRPPLSDKNSCCSSVSENDEAVEVNKISFEAADKGLMPNSDLLNALPKWTSTAKRGEKFISDEIPEAAYCLMKLARGESFDLGQSSLGCQRKSSSTDKPMIDESLSSGLANKASMLKNRRNVFPAKEIGKGKGKARVKTESNQGRVPSECKRRESYWPCEGEKMEKSSPKELNCDHVIDRKTLVREDKMKLNYTNDTNIFENNCSFDQFQKFRIKPNEEKGDPSTVGGRYRDKIFPSSQTPGLEPKNPSGGLFRAPLNKTASPAEGKHPRSETQFPKASQAVEGISQVCTPKILDFDLNEPVGALDGEDTGIYINSI